MKHPKRRVNARIRPILLALALVLSFGVTDFARAAPANDDFKDATWIGALPFSTDQDASGATDQPNEPYW